MASADAILSDAASGCGGKAALHHLLPVLKPVLRLADDAGAEATR